MKPNRVLVGVIVGAVAAAVIIADHFWTMGILSAAAVATIGFMASWELCGILEAAGLATYRRPSAFFAFLVSIAPAVLLIWRPWVSPFSVQVGVMFGFMVFAFVIAMRRENALAGTKAVVSGTFVLIYVGFSMSLLVRLREIPDVGETFLVFAIAVAKAGDTGAYFVGTRLGRHKMAPTLSPKKTVEGAMGALAAGLVVGALAWLYVSKTLTLHRCTYIQGINGLWIFLTAAVVTSVAGQFGDLAESLIKRAGNVKDSSVTFGHMGGMLDTVDSVLLSVPVAYILALLGGFRGK
jgi:phosphatidate cytidylyltransferase